MNQILASISLAWRDWKYEYLLSLCSVLALASMLAPVLVLLGLKNGVIETMRSRLMEDPAILIIIPKSDGGRFSPEFIKDLSSLPGARFVIGRTRETSTDVTLVNSATGKHAAIGLEPASPGEPVLSRYGLISPKNSKEPEIALSAPAAKALNASTGDVLTASIGRRNPDGKLESEKVNLRVCGVLPIEAADRRMAFVSLEFLEDLENYRDYIAVPERGFTGAPREKEQTYASFRLYATDLDAVESLAAELEKKNIETITRAREIAGIRLLEKAINQIILIISLAVGAGFAAFTLSSAQSAVTRKKRMLGMLRLLGFRGLPLMLYPLTQTFLTGIAGFALSFLFYLGVRFAIGEAFASQGGFECHLTWLNLAVTAGAVFLLSFLASVRASIQAANVEPSMVIREV